MEPENGTGSPLSDHFLLSACSEINSHFNLKEISQNRILHDAREPLDGDDCLVVFINRISMLHQNIYRFLDGIHVFNIRNFAIFIFYRTQLRNLRRMCLVVLLVIFQTVGCCLQALRTETVITLFLCLLLTHFDFCQFTVFLGCLDLCLRRTIKQRNAYANLETEEIALGKS